MNQIKFGDCRDIMRRWIDDGVKVQTCVTSPPYFGLRDYGVDGQIGLEETPRQFVDNMVEVFDLVYKLLNNDGVLWLNLGDCYASQPSWGRGGGSTLGGRKQGGEGGKSPSRLNLPGLKKKDLIGIPWKVAFALQESGWYLRQDIIWHKPNPMPESVKDRCTKSHEYIFLLSKSEKYYFNSGAIREPSTCGANGSEFHTGKTGEHQLGRSSKKPRQSIGKGGFNGKAEAMVDTGQNAFRAVTDMRNKRSVWTVATKPYKEAHFAVFPTELIEPCVLAGSKVGDIVLDPFMGSGTTAHVADSLGRKYLGCELNESYKELQNNRLKQQSLLL